MTATPSLDGFLQTLPKDARIGVAVSGGSDSMALLHLLAHRLCMVCACTVHHHLRPEAGDEAQFVADHCAAQKLTHDTVHWQWDGQGNLQDQARRGRYGLLSEWAKRRSISHVVLGHTADDNIETFLMGLSRGAGLDGLSGMRPSFTRAGVTFHRPLLNTRRETLRDVLSQAGIAWRDDPSNDDPTYQRIRIRQGLAALEGLGLTADMVLKTISNLQKTRRDIDAGLAKDLRGHVQMHHGDISVSLQWLDAAPPEHQRRVLNAALRFVSSRDYPPRAPKLSAFLGQKAQTATLHGCVLSRQNDALHITREHAAAQDAVGSDQTWDGRWHCSGPHSHTTRLRALGEAGIAACPDGWRALGLPRASVLASPSVWDGAELVSAPMTGWANGWAVNLCVDPPDLLASILSH